MEETTSNTSDTKDAGRSASRLARAVFGTFAGWLIGGGRIEIGALLELGTSGERVATAEQLAGEAALACGLQPEQGHAWLTRALSSLKGQLLKRQTVVLQSLGSLCVVDDGDEEGCELVFNPDEQLLARLGESVVACVTNAEFGALLTHTLRQAVLVVIPKQDWFVDTIIYHFERAGWLVRPTTFADEAKQSIAGGQTCLVLLDAAVEGAKEIAAAAKVGCGQLVPLVVMHPSGVDVSKVAVPTVIGDAQVVQPFDVGELLHTAETELVRVAAERELIKREVRLRLPTNEAAVDEAGVIVGELVGDTPLPPEGQAAMAAAIREGIGNSAQHGNRWRRNRCIELLYVEDREKISCVVTDEGPGFDHENYASTGADAVDRVRQRAASGKLGGLGIILMLKCTDQLAYNGPGNAVTLTKYFEPAAEEAAPAT